MSWPSKVCDNCKTESYTLAVKGICPYCDENLFVERVLRSPKDQDKFLKGPSFDKLREWKKKYKIKITNEQIKNIKMLKEI